MSDLISRQAAIDALAEEFYHNEEDYRTAVAVIGGLPSAEPEVRTQMSSADCISRQAAIEALDAMKICRPLDSDRYVISDCMNKIAALSSVQPDIDKQELTRMITAGIIATNTKDVYSCGMRNGMRWCRGLLEEDAPKFEDASLYAQPETHDKRTETHSCDLISRQAAIDAIRASTKKYTGYMEMEMYTDDDAVEAVEALPSAKPERKKGKWKLCGNDDDMSMTYLCSECSQQIPEDWFYSGYKNGKWIKNDIWNFCPNCGADMKGENKK